MLRVRLLLLLLAVGIVGCAPGDDAVIRFGIASAPSTLDPRFATDATSVRINRLLYRRLVEFDDSLRPIPALADWQRLAPLHYRFRLGDDGRDFHDGSRLTAHDVLATYQFVLDADNASPHRGSLTLIKKMLVIDDDTIDFFIDKPDVLFPGRLVLGIVPRQKIVDGSPLNREPMGSGPFRLLEWPADDRVRISRISDGQAIEIQRIADPTVRALKIARGEMDLLQNDMPGELIGWLDSREGISVQHGRGSNFSYLGFNMADPVTGQFAVRKAIAHALDRDAIIQYLLGAGAQPAEALLPPDHWAGHPGLPALEHDLEKARALLSQAGFDAQHPARLTYKTSSDPLRIRLATIIQHQLGEVGIDVDLRSYDWGTFYGDIKAGRFQMYSLAWVGIKMPDIFRYVFHSSAIPPGGANRGRLNSKVADGLIEQAESADSFELQARGYRNLQQWLHKELPYVPLWYEDHVLISRDTIEGYRLARDGNFDSLETVKRKTSLSLRSF